MSGFSLIADPQNSEYKNLRIASQAYTIGDSVMWDRTSDAVDVVPATSSTITGNIAGVAMETVTSSATSLLVCLANPQQYFTTDATNATNTNHNFQRMVLTNKATVNNTGSDNAAGIFLQTGIVSSTRIVGRFLVGAEAAS